jgi:hypothetical protein
MTSKIIGFKIPTHYANIPICGFVFVMLMFANLLPASAAAIGVQPGILNALGQPATAINSTPSPDLLLVRGGGGQRANRGGGGGQRANRGGGGRQRANRGGGGRQRANRGGGGRQRAYRSQGRKRRSYGGRSFYYGSPLYAYAPYYGYYSYRPYYGRCEYWNRICADNWGYQNPDYYDCMRYQGCY